MPPIVVGDLAVIRYYAERARAPAAAARAGGNRRPSAHAITVAPVSALAANAFVPGTTSAAAGAATVAYVEAAVELVRRGVASAIVACPHSETAVNAAGIPFSGYPSLLARLLGVPADRVFLMLVGGGLRIVHATCTSGCATRSTGSPPSSSRAPGSRRSARCSRSALRRPRSGLRDQPPCRRGRPVR